MRPFHVEQPAGVLRMLNPPSTMPGVLAEIWLTIGSLRVCVSLDPIHPIFGEQETPTYHLSASFSGKSPTWDQLRDARYNLLPHVDYMAQLLPPLSEYVNFHRYTHHLHEILK